jgi:hypothetical protein
MTLTFKEYLTESTGLETSKLKHLEHLEDHPINAGAAGLKHAINTLEHAKKTMAGEDTGHKISTKWDGCVSGNTELLTETHGVMSIKEIFENWSTSSNLKVLGYNKAGEIEFTQVLDKLAYLGDKAWVEIELDAQHIIKVTDDHQVMLSSGQWIEAKDLNIGDDIFGISLLDK